MKIFFNSEIIFGDGLATCDVATKFSKYNVGQVIFKHPSKRTSGKMRHYNDDSNSLCQDVQSFFFKQYVL